MDIKQMALEAARAHAHDIDDLIVKASKIEAYLLGSTALTTPLENLRAGDPAVEDEISKNISVKVSDTFMIGDKPLYDDDSRELIALAKGLTRDLGALGYSELDAKQAKRIAEEHEKRTRFEERMMMAASLLGAVSFEGELPPMEDLAASRRVENFTVGGGENLRPTVIQIADMMKSQNMVVNACRRFGSTTMIAAFARQQRTSGKFNKILVLTNTYGNVCELTGLIDDTSVNVLTFVQAAERLYAGEKYNHILIDNAAYIPYAIEKDLRAYVEQCTMPDGLIALVSVPGQECGWFYDAFTDERAKGLRISVNWTHSDITPERAAVLRRQVSEDVFKNQFENKFRPFATSVLEIQSPTAPPNPLG